MNGMATPMTSSGGPATAATFLRVSFTWFASFARRPSTEQVTDKTHTLPLQCDASARAAPFLWPSQGPILSQRKGRPVGAAQSFTIDVRGSGGQLARQSRVPEPLVGGHVLASPFGLCRGHVFTRQFHLGKFETIEFGVEERVDLPEMLAVP